MLILHIYKLYIYIYMFKTLRVTDVSKGDCMIYEQGASRNLQETPGSTWKQRIYTPWRVPRIGLGVLGISGSSETEGGRVNRC